MTAMATGLEGHVVVIIGGTAGLGLSAATACLAAGASVVALGRSGPSASQAKDVLAERAEVLTADATDPAAAEQAIGVALSTYGRLDALYHVAGGSGRRHGDGPLHELTDEGLDFTLRLNLTSMIYSNRAAVRHWLAEGRPGVVLNMGSVLGSSPSPRYFATHTYAAAKAAIVGFTRSCAAYYAPHGIRFNVIAPGLVETPMAKRAAGDREILQFISGKQPLDGGRMGRPDDLDAAVVMLLSDASRFITGQVLAVDGGWSVSEGQVTGPDGEDGP
jgi:NAD(P)-dependent dehydrogenase (short-subunit alcohol dehydrogenase family)